MYIILQHVCGKSFWSLISWLFRNKLCAKTQKCFSICLKYLGPWTTGDPKICVNEVGVINGNRVWKFFLEIHMKRHCFRFQLLSPCAQPFEAPPAVMGHGTLLYPCSPWYDAPGEWLFVCSGDATQSDLFPISHLENSSRSLSGWLFWLAIQKA